MHTAERITLARLPSGVRIETTVHRYGTGEGPTVYVQAAQHGREINGTDLLRRLHVALTDSGGSLGGPSPPPAPTDGSSPPPDPVGDSSSHPGPPDGPSPDPGDADGPSPDPDDADGPSPDPDDADGPSPLPDHVDADSLSGTLIAVPLADPLTFDRVSYTTPEPIDSANPNMNRCWPGNPEGTVHERMAASLWTYASEADAIVDLHTGSPEMLTHTVYLRGDAESRRLAEAFGTDVLLAEAAGDDADSEWAERDFGGKLRVAATREGIPSITPELGSNKQLDAAAIRTGLEGLVGVFQETGLTDGTPDDWDGIRARNHLGRVRAAESGLFVIEPDAAVGQPTEPGDEFGTVYAPTSYEPLQAVTADREGIVYSLARESTVTAGQTLVGIAERIDGPNS